MDEPDIYEARETHYVPPKKEVIVEEVRVVEEAPAKVEGRVVR